MAVRIAGWLVTLLTIYCAAGLLFAVPFVWRGVDRIDPVAGQSTRGFRVMIVPGVVALWPWLLLRWLRAAGPPDERNAHRLAARSPR